MNKYAAVGREFKGEPVRVIFTTDLQPEPQPLLMVDGKPPRSSESRSYSDVSREWGLSPWGQFYGGVEGDGSGAPASGYWLKQRKAIYFSLKNLIFMVIPCSRNPRLPILLQYVSI